MTHVSLANSKTPHSLCVFECVCVFEYVCACVYAGVSRPSAHTMPQVRLEQSMTASEQSVQSLSCIFMNFNPLTLSIAGAWTDEQIC